MRAKISSPDKRLFPADGITKLDLATYYERVGEWIVPHVRDRPLSLQIFPDGIEGTGFFQKNVPKHYPDWIRRVEVRKEGGKVIHPVVTDGETLPYLVGQNSVTPHVWLSRCDRIHQPDRMVVDLDPPPGEDFPAVRRAARRAGELELRDPVVRKQPFVRARDLRLHEGRSRTTSRAGLSSRRPR